VSRLHLLESLDPAVSQRQLGRKHIRGRPRFHQATIVAKIAATACAVLIRSITLQSRTWWGSRIRKQCNQMEPLPLSPRGGAGAAMP
jgi:hypothetical protein